MYKKKFTVWLRTDVGIFVLLRFVAINFLSETWKVFLRNNMLEVKLNVTDIVLDNTWGTLNWWATECQ